MSDFERALVQAFNRYFEDNDIHSIAYRRKQHRFSSQVCDILVDSQHPEYYLAIENKSISLKSRKKLYFSQHFSTEPKHQVERISQFLRRSGRKGYLALEVKRGRGKARKAYLLPWDFIKQRYEGDACGVPVDKAQEFPEIKRNGTDYKVAHLFNS